MDNEVTNLLSISLETFSFSHLFRNPNLLLLLLSVTPVLLLDNNE